MGLTRSRGAGPEQVRALSAYSPVPWSAVLPQGFVYDGVMSIPGVHRAATLIADIIGGMPWDAYRNRAGKREKLDPLPLLLQQPAPPETRVTSMASWVLDYLLRGNAVGIIQSRDSNGTPTAIAPVPAHLVWIRDIRGEVEYHILSDSYTRHDVFHVKNWSPPGWLRGFGVLETHLHGGGALDLAAALEKEAQTVSRHGVPTGLLKVTNPDATRDQLLEAKSIWIDGQSDRSIGVLNSTTDFVPLAWSPSDTQLVQAREFSLLQIADIFGVPPRFLGAPSGGSLTYATAETESLDLLKFTISGHLLRFEAALSALLPNGTEAKANVDSLLRADTAARYAAHSVGIQAGFLLRSEARELEDLKPVAGIDNEPLPKKAEMGVAKTDPISPTVAQVPAPGSKD